MSDVCGDNRFEIIEAYKKKLIEDTNIESRPEEMAVIDNILLRFWQMGWLPDVPDINVGDTIYRRDAIDAVAEGLKGTFFEYRDIAEKMLNKVPSAQPDLDEWCTTCKEYDQERHSCPRWNRVIRETLKDAQPEPCDDAVKSHSEKDILSMCISLLDEMVGYFSRYMEWLGYEPTDEEKQCGYFGMTYFHIVQKLFLYRTSHSGGSSTFKKCHELGIDDPSEGVRFSIWEEEDE